MFPVLSYSECSCCEYSGTSLSVKICGGGACSVMSDSLLWTVAHQASPYNSPGKNTGVGCHILLQEIFLTQESSGGCVCVCVCVCVSWVSTRNGIAGSYNRCIKIYLNVFQRNCIILHYDQQDMRVPAAPYPYQHLISFFKIFCHFKRYVVLCYYSFNLYFPDDYLC